MNKTVIITNNPLVEQILSRDFNVRMLDTDLRGVLVYVRDQVYAGHALLTHPLAGSVKPNETPYKSVMISEKPVGFDAEQGEIISNAIAVCDKFKPIGWELNQRILNDFQLVDYTLICSAVDFDARSGLSNKSNS